MRKNSISQQQVLKQKLTFQNIQLFKMMELNLLQFDQKVKEELELNPALENLEDYEIKRVDFGIENTQNNDSNQDSVFSNMAEDLYSSSQSIQNSNLEQENNSINYYSDLSREDEERDLYLPVIDNDTLISNLNNQIQYLNLSKEQLLIGEYIIGSIDDDGYIRRSMENIVDDLSFRQNVNTNLEQVEEMLDYIQEFDPPGIAARNLQECLILQLKRKKYSKNVAIALDIITDSFELFTKKQNERILKKYKLTKEQLSEINKIILSLNPKPTEKSDNESTLGKYIIPDFIVYRNENKLELELHSYNQPNLTINSDFVDMLKKIKAEKKKTKSEKEAQEYVMDKINKANQFLSLIKERQETMVIVMNTILELQHDFFISGSEMDLKPMGLKHIAALTHFDISTVSRITNSKYVQTEFGVFSLKFFFSESMTNEDGTEVSNRSIMKVIEGMVADEDKSNPLSDDQITINLENLGYRIARRTTAKYRENLNIPPKHYRKLTAKS
jgi:RNA polymerase sigma-54 factor